MGMPEAILKKGREKSLLRKHPWVFSGAIHKAAENVNPGESVSVVSASGEILGIGAWSPNSQIRVRMWTFDPDEKIDPDFFKRKIQSANEVREKWFDRSVTNAYRIINAESDGIPGLIVDRYNMYLVCQFLTTGAEFWREAIFNVLTAIFPDLNIYDRSDADILKKEGLRPKAGLLKGSTPDGPVESIENGLKFYVDIIKGHKTGFYLDQRANREFVGKFCKNGEVLNCFSYTGGFGVYALEKGARKVINIDASQDALNLSKKNIELNNLPVTSAEHIQSDVFKLLRVFRAENRKFDVIILDPPKFVDSAANLKRASRGYKDINMLAFSLLRPGGVLFTFSCSGLMNRDLFQKIVSDAALDAGREAQIIHWLSQDRDHPTLLSFPEGLYLKGLVCSSMPSL